MRKETTEVVFNKYQYDAAWPPGNATECVAWFAEKVASIPAKYRDTARIDIDSESYCEENHCGHISITFRRPETDEEMAERECRLEQQKRAQEEMERKQLVALKMKYGQ
jgi:hypothetical protein